MIQRDCYIDNTTFCIDKADEGTIKLPYFSSKTSCHRSITYTWKIL